MKYVVVSLLLGGLRRELPVVFPDMLSHKDVAGKVEELLRHDFPRATNILTVSAGFVNSLDLMMKDSCYGESATLGVQSRGETDAALIRMHDYRHGLAEY